MTADCTTRFGLAAALLLAALLVLASTAEYLPAGQFAATDFGSAQDSNDIVHSRSYCAIGTAGETMATTRGAVAQISNGNGLNPTATAKTTTARYRSDGPHCNRVSRNTLP